MNLPAVSLLQRVAPERRERHQHAVKLAALKPPVFERTLLQVSVRLLSTPSRPT